MTRFHETAPRLSRSSDRGSQLIEMAMVFPLLMILLAAIVDYGLLFQRYEVVANAAREGARVGSLPDVQPAGVETRVRDYFQAAGLNRGLGTVAVSTVSVAPGGGGAAFPARQVNVTYPYDFVFIRPMLQLIGAGFASSINLRASSVMRTEVVVGV